MDKDVFDALWANEDYRVQLASTYLKDVFNKDFDLSDNNLNLVRFAINTVLHEEYKNVPDE